MPALPIPLNNSDIGMWQMLLTRMWQMLLIVAILWFWRMMLYRIAQFNMIRLAWLLPLLLLLLALALPLVIHFCITPFQSSN
jgi:hypothetical protein